MLPLRQSFAWVEDKISMKIPEGFTGVSGITIECNNLQIASEIIELIWGPAKIKNHHRRYFLQKSLSVNNEFNFTNYSISK